MRVTPPPHFWYAVFRGGRRYAVRNGSVHNHVISYADNKLNFKKVLENFIKKYNTIQYNTIQYNTIQYNIIQYNTIQYNTIQYNTIQYN